VATKNDSRVLIDSGERRRRLSRETGERKKVFHPDKPKCRPIGVLFSKPTNQEKKKENREEKQELAAQREKLEKGGARYEDPGGGGVQKEKLGKEQRKSAFQNHQKKGTLPGDSKPEDRGLSAPGEL